MPQKKTPTSSLSVIELLAKRIWYRSKARIRGIRSEGAHWRTSSTTRPSPAMRIPQEIIEVIVAHLIYDLLTLCSCSLTCYSWYIAAVPHLHPTLTVFTYPGIRERQWPNQITRMHTLGLLPFVKTLRIHCISEAFSPRLFNSSILRQFSALTNIQTLKIDNLDISSFMPRIRRYFGPFLPTLRSLHLRSPEGSNRQIIHFVGLFRHLDDLSLAYRGFDKRNLEEDPMLIPLFVPPLQGRLVVACWRKTGLFQEMVRLFEGINFRTMDLYEVGETQLLLRACAETLQVLQLHPDDSLAMTSLQDFDLSRNKCLRTLEVQVWATINELRNDPDRASMLLKYTLSTIRSSTFSQVKIIYWRHQILELDQPECFHERLGLFRKLRKARDFLLVLHAIGWEREMEFMVPKLKVAVEAEKERMGFNDLFPEPSVTFAPLSHSQIESL